MGRWRLTPPEYGGDAACGEDGGVLRRLRRLHLIRPLRRDGRRGTPHPSASLTPSPQGEGFGRVAFSTADPSRGRLTGVRGVEDAAPYKGKAVFRLRAGTGDEGPLIRRCAPPSPQGEGFGCVAFNTADPSRGRLTLRGVEDAAPYRGEAYTCGGRRENVYRD